LISGGAPLDDVLATLVHLIEAQSEGLICSILLLDDDERVHHIAAPSLPESFVKAIDGLRIGPSAGSCGTAMYLGRPVVVSDLRTDPLWEDYRDAAQPLGVLACWSTPIFIEKHRVVGSFAIYCRDPRSPTDEETKLIDIATYIAAIAIERTRATQALLLKHEQIRDLAGKLIAAQEEERKRVARDLHDDLGQKIASVGMHISAVKKTLAARSEPIRRKLEAVEDEIDTLMNDLRELSHELYPTLLRRVGLEAALRSLCEEFSRSEEIDLLFSFPQPVVAIPENIALCLYRVAQEALRNIAKHARAKHIDVVISAADGQIDLRVSDDGRGFDREDMKLQGLGINNMEERVRLCHGRFQITSELGLGTTVRVQIRLTDS
jgi:signal transduction histidine kinase